MALVLKDRVKETTTTTGTGIVDLAGAVTGFETFVSAVGSGNACYYTILDANGSAWEVGTGTVTDASPDTLSRTTILESSNSDNAITLTAGTHTVFLTYPADKSVYRNTNDQIVTTASGIIFSDATVQTTAPVDTNTQLSTEQVQDIAGSLIDTGGTKTGITITYDDANNDIDFVVDHDAASNFVANEHINHTSVTLTAGSGLSGGGDISSNRTFHVSGVDTSLLQGTVANNQLANSSVTITAGTGLSNGGSVALGGSVSIDVDHGSIDHDSLNNFVANEHIDHTSVTLTAGSGLSGGGDISSNRTFHVSGVDTSLLQGTVANNQLANSSVTITAGTGLSNGGSVALGGTVTLDVETLNQNTTGSAATLTTSRNINDVAFNGSANITVTAAGSTLSDTVPVSKGGTNTTSFPDKSVLITQDTGTDTVSGVAIDANGELLIGGTSGPAVATLTQGSNVTITNADGGITIAAADTTYTAGSGLTLVGTEFNTAGTGNFEAIDFGGYSSIVKIGYAAGSGIQYSLNTVAIGYLAGAEASGTVASHSGNNIFLGTRAGRSASGCDYSNYIGYEAGKDANLSKYSNAFGRQSLTLSSNSNYNNAIGYRAGDELSSSNSNSFIGREAGCHASGIDTSVYIGNYAGCRSTGCANSVFLGQNAGTDAQGSGNIYIGRQSGRSGTGSDNIEIVTGGVFSTILGSSSDKIHIENIIVGDTSSKKLAIGNVGSSNLSPNATLEILPLSSDALGVSGVATFSSGVVLNNAVPGSTTNSLYNDGGTLKFNGSTVGGGGSARSVAGDTDNGVITWVTSDNTFAVEPGLRYDAGTLTVTGIIDVTNVLDASDATGDTGAIRTEGGVSIAKKLYVGGTLATSSNIDCGYKLRTALIGYTDGDNAITIADGGAVTFDQSINQAHEAGSLSSNILSFDCSQSNYFEATVNAQVNSIVFTNATAGQRIILLITNSTSSAHLSDANGWDTITINTDSGGDVLWAGGIEPTLTASGKDMYGIVFSSNVLVAHGFIIGQDIKA